MAGHNLTNDGEFRYIIQWFNEWSELQREDFVPVLIEYFGENVYVNGVVQGMANSTCSDKPMSLFQCRVKLFKEWSCKWPEDYKIKLKEKIIEIDPSIGEKLKEELLGNMVNGVGDGDRKTLLETSSPSAENRQNEEEIPIHHEEVSQNT